MFDKCCFYFDDSYVPRENSKRIYTKNLNLLISEWCDYRYFWLIHLFVVFLCVLHIFQVRKQKVSPDSCGWELDWL